MPDVWDNFIHSEMCFWWEGWLYLFSLTDIKETIFIGPSDKYEDEWVGELNLCWNSPLLYAHAVCLHRFWNLRWEMILLTLSPRLYTLSNDILAKKTASCFTNIWDISTKLIPLYSPLSPPSSEPKSIFLAPILLKLAYLAMLFIFQVTHC